MARKRWNELSEAQKAATVTAAAVQIALAAAAWTDLARRPTEQVRGSKAVWAVAIAVNFVGPISYFALGRRREALGPALVPRTAVNEQQNNAMETGSHTSRSPADGVAAFNTPANAE